MSVYGDGTFGASPFGSGVLPFRVLGATPLNSNTLRVFLSDEPRHRSRLSSDDALNRLNWTLEVVSGPGDLPSLETPENALAQPDLISGEPDAWSVDLRLDRRLLLSTVYRVIGSEALRSLAGDLLAPDPEDRATCPGIMVPRPRRPPRTSRAAIGVDLFYDTFRAAWRVDGRGDIDVHAGDDARRKRIIRCLISGKGRFKHLPSYGLGLRAKDPFTTTDVAKLRADARAQILEEDDIADAAVDVQTFPNGLIVKVRARPVAGTEIALTFEVPPEGPVVVG